MAELEKSVRKLVPGSQTDSREVCLCPLMCVRLSRVMGVCRRWRVRKRKPVCEEFVNMLMVIY